MSGDPILIQPIVEIKGEIVGKVLTVYYTPDYEGKLELTLLFDPTLELLNKLRKELFFPPGQKVRLAIFAQDEE